MRVCAALPLALLLLLAGCGGLFTQTEFFEFDLVHDGQPLTPGAPIVLSTGTVIELSVDLSEVDSFEEHSDEIENVDRVGLEGRLQAAGASGFSLYLSRQTGLTDPVNEATLLLRNFRLGAAATGLDFEATEELIEGLSDLEDAVRAGSFQLYLVGQGPADLTLDALDLVVAFTVGL